MSRSRNPFVAISILLAMIFAQSVSLASQDFEQLKLSEKWLREKPPKPIDPQNSASAPVPIR